MEYLRSLKVDFCLTKTLDDNVVNNIELKLSHMFNKKGIEVGYKLNNTNNTLTVDFLRSENVPIHVFNDALLEVNQLVTDALKYNTLF